MSHLTSNTVTLEPMVTEEEQIKTVVKPQVKPKKRIYHAFKRLMDIILSIIGLAILIIPFFIISAVIYLNDRGNVFYCPTRIGKNGKSFKMYKFRTMHLNADDIENYLTPEQLQEYLTTYKIENDPRITKVGNFLRKTSLDETPQLLNVLFGHMTLIGPRPVLDAETKFYGKDRDELLSVKPGVTGYWQAYARNDITYENGERQKMEMYYVRNESFVFDMKILFHTFYAVISKKGAS